MGDKKDKLTLVADYEILNLSSSLITTTFAVEFNLSMLAGNAPDRFYYNSRNNNLGVLVSQGESIDETLFGIKDIFQKIDISIGLNKPASIWYFPIQTVSQSEQGFELVYQSSVLLPRWKIALQPQGKWQVQIKKICKYE